MISKLAVLIGLVAVCSTGVEAQTHPTTEDSNVAKEQAIANPQVKVIYELRNREMARLLSGQSGRPSTEVLKIVEDTSTTPIDLGDTTIPLHLRLIKLAQLDLVDGIAAAKVAMPSNEMCDIQSGFGEELFENKGRQHALEMIKCSRDGLDRAQAAMHGANKQHESRLAKLNLPPFTRDKWLAQARESTAMQDADVKSTYQHWRTTYQALEDWVRFLNDHAKSFHVENSALVFINDADASAARELQLKVAEALAGSGG
jgi:hypothetical protein